MEKSVMHNVNVIPSANETNFSFERLPNTREREIDERN